MNGGNTDPLLVAFYISSPSDCLILVFIACQVSLPEFLLGCQAVGTADCVMYLTDTDESHSRALSKVTVTYDLLTGRALHSYEQIARGGFTEQ